MSQQNKLMGVGQSAASAAQIVGDVASGLTAAGTGQTDALALSCACNYVETVASGTGVRLYGSSGRPSSIGDEQTVYNTGANALSVYPPSGEQIVGAAQDAAFSVPVGVAVTFKKVKNTLWLVVSGDAAFERFVQSGSATLGTVAAAIGDLCVNVRNSPFNAVGDGTTDDTVAIQAAITFAEASGRQATVFFPSTGYQYRTTDTLTSTRGVRLLGDGPLYGTDFKFEPSGNNKPWLLMNGTYGFKAGGGVENMRIMKNNAATGCTAIKLLATDDNHRPGEIILRNVFITGYDSTVFNWVRGLHVDGTACTTVGSKGVRSILMEKVRVTNCSTDNEYILLNQAVHVFGNMLQLDAVGGTGICGMTISGDSDNIILNGMGCNGTMIINGSSQMFVTLGGKITTLDVNNTLVEGGATIAVSATGGITNAAKNFRIVSNKASAFLGVCTTATANNKTGDNTAYNVIYDSETYDKNDEFDPSGGTFTAKIAGRYKVAGKIELRNLGAAHTRSDCAILHKNSGGVIQATYNAPLNPFACGTNAGANFAHFVAAEVELAEGDLLQMSAQVSGSTKTVGVSGNTIANGDFTWFSAHLLA